MAISSSTQIAESPHRAARHRPAWMSGERSTAPGYQAPASTTIGPAAWLQILACSDLDKPCARQTVVGPIPNLPKYGRPHDWNNPRTLPDHPPPGNWRHG